MYAIAERNRAIKALLTRQFGKGTVKVRSSRGTAYGWLNVDINYRPKNRAHREEIEATIWKLLNAAGLGKQIDTYGYDDPGSDYGFGRKIHFNFGSVLEKEFWEMERSNDPQPVS